MAKDKPPAELIAAANSRLRASGLRVALKLQGRTLYMVATLPPRPHEQHKAAYQQALSTGQPATRLGVRYAESQARQLGDRVAAWRANRKNNLFFDWTLYPTNRSEGTLIVSEAVAAFEAHYRETSSLQDKTWAAHWAQVFRQLPQGKPLQADMLKALALSKPRGTHARRKACQKLQCLADFHGIEIDLLQYKGDYGPSKVKPRELPSDKEIAYWREQIPDPAWRWVYGILAAGGLRPHEAFFCRWNPEGDRLDILKGKTGARSLSLNDFFYKEWVDLWGLREIRLPKIDAENAYEKATLGKGVNRQFKRYGVPFTSYVPRHCSAIRMALFNVPTSVAARILGHTPTVHMATYHKHLNEAQHQQATRQAQAASDRPQVPTD